MDIQMIKNPFASVVWFYYQRMRNKLTANGLLKIAKKYGSKSQGLLPDLSSKYGEVPENVSMIDVLRICNQFAIPEVYLKLMPEVLTAQREGLYQKELDACSADFNVEMLFSTRSKLCMRDSNIAPLDNLSKVKHLVPGYMGFTPHLSKIENTVISATKHLKSRRETETKLPIVDRIAIDSTYNHNVDGEGGSSSLREQWKNKHLEPDKLSPLFMLYQCMMQKLRIRVAIRDRRRLRGHLVGYITAFDKHFNLLLRDVDEVYSVRQALLQGQAEEQPSSPRNTGNGNGTNNSSSSITGSVNPTSIQFNSNNNGSNSSRNCGNSCSSSNNGSSISGKSASGKSIAGTNSNISSSSNASGAAVAANISTKSSSSNNSNVSSSSSTTNTASDSPLSISSSRSQQSASQALLPTTAQQAKYQTKKRHLAWLLVRGDNVVLIQKLDV